MRSNSAAGVIPVRIDTTRAGLSMVLGSLELSIMQAVWELGKPSANKEIRYQMACSGTQVAIATVSTTTRRLADKGYLFEAEDHGSYVYRAVMSEDELEVYVVELILSKLREAWPDVLNDAISCEQCELEYGHDE